MPLHVVGFAANGRMYYTSRNIYLTTPWRPWEDVTALVGDLGSPFTIIDCATVGGEVHVCGVTEDRRLLHTFRNQNGTWQGFWGDVGAAAGFPGHEFTLVGLAGMNNELHVCATARPRPSGGGLTQAAVWFVHHAIRSSNPASWTLPFRQVESGLVTRENVFHDLACANVGGSLHICAMGSRDELWHSIRLSASPSNFQPFQDVRTQSATPGPINSIGIAGIGNRLHVCAQIGGSLFHTIRASSSWQREFGNVTAVMRDAFKDVLTNIACANVEDNLHICCVTTDGSILHTIRMSNPQSWQNPEGSGRAVFGNVTAVVGALGPTPGPGPFSLVAVAGT